jgi:hypothetical protein
VGWLKNVGDFYPPTVPKVPNPLQHKEDFRATFSLKMPKRVPARKCFCHRHSGDLGDLGGG